MKLGTKNSLEKVENLRIPKEMISFKTYYDLHVFLKLHMSCSILCKRGNILIKFYFLFLFIIWGIFITFSNVKLISMKKLFDVVCICLSVI